VGDLRTARSAESEHPFWHCPKKVTKNLAGNIPVQLRKYRLRDQRFAKSKTPFCAPHRSLSSLSSPKRGEAGRRSPFPPMFLTGFSSNRIRTFFDLPVSRLRNPVRRLELVVSFLILLLPVSPLLHPCRPPQCLITFGRTNRLSVFHSRSRATHVLSVINKLKTVSPWTNPTLTIRPTAFHTERQQATVDVFHLGPPNKFSATQPAVDGLIMCAILKAA